MGGPNYEFDHVINYNMLCYTTIDNHDALCYAVLNVQIPTPNLPTNIVPTNIA